MVESELHLGQLLCAAIDDWGLPNDFGLFLYRIRFGFQGPHVAFAGLCADSATAANTHASLSSWPLSRLVSALQECGLLVWDGVVCACRNYR